MTITLTRHTSVDVPRGTCYGWSDVPVRDTFEQEAAAVKSRLDAMEPFDAAYTSPLSRATKLAAFCGYHDAIRDERLKEISMGQWEMRRYDQIDDPRLQRWYDDFLHIEPTGGESFDMFYARVAAFLDDLRRRQHRRVAIFAHGGVLLCAGVYAGLYSMEECMAHQADYGGSLTIEL